MGLAQLRGSCVRTTTAREPRFAIRYSSRKVHHSRLAGTSVWRPRKSWPALNGGEAVATFLHLSKVAVRMILVFRRSAVGSRQASFCTRIRLTESSPFSFCDQRDELGLRVGLPGGAGNRPRRSGGVGQALCLSAM